jgi:hypothetical protein
MLKKKSFFLKKKKKINEKKNSLSDSVVKIRGRDVVIYKRTGRV